MIAFLNFTKSFAESGLVKGMAIMSAVGEFSMDLDPLNIFPETKRYQQMRCLVCLDGE